MATDNSEIVEAMLTADSGEGGGDGGNASPSPVAAQSGNSAVAAAPVEVEAGSVNGNDRTPLHDAVLDQDIEVVEALLDAGADPNVRGGPLGVTPLHAAAENGNLELVGMLLAAGADPEARLSVETPLDFAERHGHSAVVSLLREAVAVIGPVGGGGGNEVGGPVDRSRRRRRGVAGGRVRTPGGSLAAAEPVEHGRSAVAGELLEAGVLTLRSWRRCWTMTPGPPPECIPWRHVARPTVADRYGSGSLQPAPGLAATPGA